jgi:hypothetical protein
MSAAQTQTIWSTGRDYRQAWAPTADPRVVAVVMADDDNAEAPDYDATVPTILGYEWGSRANLTTIGGSSRVPDAWIRARSEHPYGIGKLDADQYADRFVRAFYGASAIHYRSQIDQYTWAVSFNDPAWRELVGCPDDASPEDLIGEVRAYLDGEVFGIGYAVCEGRVDAEIDIPDDLEGFEVTMTCWGFYGEDYAKRSALDRDQEWPEASHAAGASHRCGGDRVSPTPRRAGARWLDGDCPAAVPAIFDNGARAVSAPEFRILIALPGNRGRAYIGLRKDAHGNVDRHQPATSGARHGEDVSARRRGCADHRAAQVPAERGIHLPESGGQALTTTINPTSKAVSEIADFDHVFAVWHSPDGVVAISDDPAMAPELREIGHLHAPEAFEPDADAATLDGWELPLSGFTGQYGYSGPWLHDSEVIEGCVGEYVLAHPGYWVAIYGSYSPENCASCNGSGAVLIEGDEDNALDSHQTCTTCNGNGYDPEAETVIEGWTLAYRPFPSTTQQNGDSE